MSVPFSENVITQVWPLSPWNAVGAAQALRALWEDRETQSLLCPAWASDPCPPDPHPKTHADTFV